ncbi:MAG: preprotein translocase subunit SecY [Clostridia bacterium]|nr:preprotein translocase subunit SecY [Clostridia bacterium]
MLQTLKNAWKVPDLRKKILFTALIIFIFRLGANIPVPFLEIGETGLFDANSGNTFMSYLTMMTGEAFNYGTLFAMSITPYINSSIIIQLLTVAIPALERLSKEGEEGRKKISAITRYTAIGLALIQSTAYFLYIRSGGYLSTDASGAAYTGFWAVFQALVVILILTAGSCLVMWLGEQINVKGIGNGISMILFAGIISRIPVTVTLMYQHFQQRGVNLVVIPLAAVVMLLMIPYIVWMDNAEQRIPVQYAKRVVGRKMYGGQNSYIPIKVNMSGVLPIIFASSILSIPPTINMFVRASEESHPALYKWLFHPFEQTHWVYGIIYFVLIIFFAYFYSAIQYNPVEMANNLRKNGGTVPFVRPGKPTSDYIAKIISKIVLLGALLLSVVALFPIVFSQIATLIGADASGISMGGTSVIIVVGVALETVRQLESQMMMRHYKGFLD